MASSTLPEPSFVDRDGAAITADAVAMYEAMTGKTLYPAQPERLLVDVVAYRELIWRIAQNEAAKLNLVRYSRGPILDYLGELVRVYRLEAQPARCTVRVLLKEAQAEAVVIPAGTALAAKGGELTFSTVAALLIAPGLTTGQVEARANAAGTSGNGFMAGEVEADGVLPDAVESISSITMTYGGADLEDDERLRLRVLLGPEGFAVAGPFEAYRSNALAVHQDIVDVGVSQPWPGLVAVYPLMRAGQPSREILDLVFAALNDRSVRPLTDTVSVRQPRRVVFEIRAGITLATWADPVSVAAQAKALLEDHAAGLRLKLGGAVVASRLLTLIGQVPGVQDVVMEAPSANMTLAANEYADCTAIAVNVTGFANAD